MSRALHTSAFSEATDVAGCSAPRVAQKVAICRISAKALGSLTAGVCLAWRRASGLFRPGQTALIYLAASLLLLSGCSRVDPRIRALEQENAQLKRSLQELQQRLDPTPQNWPLNLGDKLTAPDLQLTINELWSQRFDDQKFRAKQRLDGKVLRVSGTIGRISPTLITLEGHGGDMGDVTLTIALDGTYSARIREGLAALEQGMPVVTQGRFAFDKLWLSDAVLVDSETGFPMSPEKIMALNPDREVIEPRVSRR